MTLYILIEQNDKPPRLFESGGSQCFWEIVQKMRHPAGVAQTPEDPSLVKFVDGDGSWASLRLIELEGRYAIPKD